MHLGHAFSAMVASHIGGGYILRIDDIDHTRCQDKFVTGILDDLRWLGLAWRGAPVFQSDRLATYEDCLLYTSPSPRDGLLSRMPSSA